MYILPMDKYIFKNVSFASGNLLNVTHLLRLHRAQVPQLGSPSLYAMRRHLDSGQTKPARHMGALVRRNAKMLTLHCSVTVFGSRADEKCRRVE